MAIFKCKMCGGTLEINNNETVAVCEYCGTKQTLPKLDDDRKANLYDRANHFRRNNEFDKAMGIYEQILNEDNADAEAYWSLVLCKYGIEYVEDPATHKRVPTVNRAQFTSVFADEDYKSALKYADGYQRDLYEEEAKAIDEIQKGILAISQKEEPFDVFICYKETDNFGRRTPDSVLANDLYHQLSQEGFKVFFSRITLEDKLGTAYEPYIFAALNSSKVMVVLGTKPEYFNAVWVKNEWSRYLALIKNGAKKMLIPAYKDMDPYDLPDEFSHLQAQDMSKLGFMQDLIRGIKKILQTDEPKATPKETVVISGGNANTEPLLKRAFIFLEDRDWQSADEYCEKVLDIDPENAQAYLGKLMAELQVRTQDELKNEGKPFDDRNNYQKALRFGDNKLKDTLKGYIAHINERNENARLEGIYTSAVKAMENASTQEAFKKAAKDFKSISYYKDSKSLAEQCFEKADIIRKNEIYDAAKALVDSSIISKLEYAITQFESISDWKDSAEQIGICHVKIEELEVKAEADRLERERQAEIAHQEAEKRAKTIKKIAIIITPIICAAIAFVVVLNAVIIPNNKYNQAIEFENNGDYSNAILIFTELEDFKDSKDHLNSSIYNQALIYEKNKDYFKALSEFRTIMGYKDSKERIKDLLNKNVNSVSAGLACTVGLKSDGTVVATEYKGDYYKGQCDVSNWKNIIAISAGYGHTIGLKLDGTVVAIGNNDYGQCDVSKWNDIVAVSASDWNTVGLKSDGTVVAVGFNIDGKCDVSDWKDIVAISAGPDHTVGLKLDGTVVAVGSNRDGECDVSDWKDMVAVSAGEGYTVGLKSDGTVVAVGDNNLDQCNVSSWNNIIAISAGSDHTVGLKSDGTVVAVGYNIGNHSRQCDTSDWENIVAITAGPDQTVGLKSDGTVVATGMNYSNQCNVSDWKNIKTPEK